ncbi:MAG: BREX system P-loop protein BrxC [Halorhodospira sp.]
MKNRDVYQKDPETRNLANNGVANVNDDTSAPALDVLRYELETFVCDGEYERGVAHILDTYLKNLGYEQQPAVWISGFYGSGKSHLAKMLRALWLDRAFPDGATPRGIAHLPTSVKEHLTELSTQGKRHGGLHAASGTLGAGASGSVRLALLRIIFKSVGLPEQYPMARFVMWLQSEGVLEDVQKAVETKGYDWKEELDNFYVADGLAEALTELMPKRFASQSACVETLNNMFPNVKDVSNDEMLEAIRQALTRDGKFPLTLVVLDEVQQYIGPDAQRSLDVQEAIEACCKYLGAKLLFVGTGQTAITGTSNLAKLQGRFTVRVQLSDADVDTVIRKVILAKKPEATDAIDQVMANNLGEISRHLSGSTIAHQPDDRAYFVQDYPILPVRRRFWETALRVLDQTGTDSQLRNQLSMVHKAIQSNLDEGLGHVVPADYIYFDGAEKLLQARVLPKKVYEAIQTWSRGSEDQQLLARACALIFLINKVAGGQPNLGIVPTVDTLADLLVEDLPAGSASLRSKLPELLDECHLLMKVGEEYRIQTEESTAWNDAFRNHQSNIANQQHVIEDERDSRIRKMFGDIVRRLTLQQGKSCVSREVATCFDAELPKDADSRIYLWLRDGWSSDENTVRVEARQAGSDSPTVFCFLPKRHGDELREQLMEYKAAKYTLDERGTPNTPDGKEAREAMETTMRRADGRIDGLLEECFADARVFQGGGSEVGGNDLHAMIQEAAEAAQLRLYPQFDAADHTGWGKVLEKAKQGAPDALKAVGDDGEPGNNPVCKAILGFIAGGKSGAEIRDRFEGPPYGWSGDAVDGGLHVLMVSGHVRAQDERGNLVEPSSLDRRAIGKTHFRVESATISAAQRIQIRKLMQKLGIQATSNEELRFVPQFLDALRELADAAGGEAPRPEPPDTTCIDDLRQCTGNEQLLALYNQRETLSENIKQWEAVRDKLKERLPRWRTVKQLAQHAQVLEGTEALCQQVESIEAHRKLLDDPDPCSELASSLAQALREALNELDARYQAEHQAGMERLEMDANWQELEPEQRNSLLAGQRLTNADAPDIRVQTTDDVLATLNRIPIDTLADRVAALPSRFAQVLEEAAQLCEPEVQFIKLPRPTLQSEAAIDEWAERAKEQLKEGLSHGPVMPR